VRTCKWSDAGAFGRKIKFGETAEAALRREPDEETGLAVHICSAVQDCIHSPELTDAHFCC
jgi:8-oxo-dGTP pyrophosphatase MutT (NUDIX family)